MRRNTSEAWTELEFTGSNETPYTARWYVARAHRKISGSRTRCALDTGKQERRRTAQQKNEIKAEIQAAVGLTFEQFCRTTMLAQGDFTKSRKARKAKNRIFWKSWTGTSIYSEIGAEIYAATMLKDGRNTKTRTGSWKASTFWQKKKSPQSRKP